MELKEGYKQTEAGVIPYDWEIKKLHQVAEFINGKAHEMFINENGDYKVVNSKFVSSEGAIYKFSSKALCNLNVGDITLVMSDIPNGKALAKCFLIDQNNIYTLNQRICALTPFEDSPNYLLRALNRNKYFLAFDSGTGQTNLRRQDVLSCPVVLPSKSEQKAIANALSDAETYIKSLEILIEKKKNIKQGAMHQLLKPKKGWLETTLGEILDVITDYTANGSFESLKSMVTYYNETNYAVLVRTTDLGKDVFVPQRYTDKKGYEYLSKTSLVGGEIVIANVGSLGKVFRVPNFDSPMTLAPNTYLLRFKDSILEDFIFQWLSSKEFYTKLLSKIGSSTLQAINKDSLRSIVLSIPNNIKEQIEIAAILIDMDNEIISLENRLAKIKLIKQGMMENLLTGKIRLV